MLVLVLASCTRRGAQRAPGTEALHEPGSIAGAASGPGPAQAVAHEPHAPLASAPAWARRFGGPEGDEAAAVAVDGQGSVYVIGQITGEVAFDDIVLEGAGHSDIFVAKLSPAGEVQWARAIGGSGHDFGTGIGVSPDGKIIILGVFADDVQVGGRILRARGPQDTLLAALSADGEPLWARGLSSPVWDMGTALALDANGDIVVAGSFSGTLDVGDRIGEQVLHSGGDADAFVARFGADGAPVWARRLGGEGWDEATGVAVDREGRAVVVGSSTDTTTGATTNAVGGSAFVAVHGPGGEELWSQRMGERGTQAQGVAVGPDRRILVAGCFEGEVSLGGPALESAGGQDLFVASYDSTGEHVWSRGSGGPEADCARAILVTGTGDFVVAGAFSGDPARGGPGQNRDIFFARHDAAGKLLWSVGALAPGAGTRSIAMAPDGRLLAAGAFLGSMRLGGMTLESAGGFDAFIVALTPFPRPR